MSKRGTECAAPSAGPLVQTEESPGTETQVNKEVSKVLAKVGKPAPDFEATAFHKGEFINVKLSDYAGKWVTVCFYPGDFTFV